jgi:hypothetical protein
MPQDAPAVCFACGVVRGLEIGHLDGHEENQAPENLAYTCRSCNVTCANTLRKAGAGRLTNQYNPARNRTHYMNAVNVMLGRSRDMSLRSAIQTVQGTSHVNRAAYARGLKTNPGAETLGAYMSAVVDHRRGAHDQGGRIIHETPKARRSRFAREIARIKAERYGSGGVPDWVTSNPALSASQYGLAQAVAAGTNRLPTGMTAAAAKRMIEHTPAKLRAYFAQQLARQNPAAGSREAFKDFHGFKPTMKTTVVRTVHEHEHVAGIGELIELWIVPLDQETPEGKKDRCIRLKDFDGAWLTQSENKKLPQLFIDGGDQVIDDDTLAECGVDLDALHEVEVLGKGVLVKYYTIKTHLGREGGEAEYSHPFGETLDESGNRVFTGKASRPVITYDTVNRQLFVVGGKYTIPPEGISN